MYLCVASGGGDSPSIAGSPGAPWRFAAAAAAAAARPWGCRVG